METQTLRIHATGKTLESWFLRLDPFQTANLLPAGNPCWNHENGEDDMEER